MSLHLTFMVSFFCCALCFVLSVGEGGVMGPAVKPFRLVPYGTYPDGTPLTCMHTYMPVLLHPQHPEHHVQPRRKLVRTLNAKLGDRRGSQGGGMICFNDVRHPCIVACPHVLASPLTTLRPQPIDTPRVPFFHQEV